MTRYPLDEPSPHQSTSRQSYTYDVDDIPYSARNASHLASIAEKKRLWWRSATINALFIGLWYAGFSSFRPGYCNVLCSFVYARFSFATVLSVYNKWMFSADHFGFPFPLFVTTMHMLVQFVLAALIRNIWPNRFRPECSPSRADYM